MPINDYTHSFEMKIEYEFKLVYNLRELLYVYDFFLLNTPLNCNLYYSDGN